MRNRIIESVESGHLKKQPPKFDIGDTVSVAVRIVEGAKERIQPFVGVVIARRGRGPGEMFTVRRIVNNEGVERVFPLHSPRIAEIEVQRHGTTRRGKLYFLRERVGKARKLRERRAGAKEGSGAEAKTGEGRSPASRVRNEEAVAAV